MGNPILIRGNGGRPRRAQGAKKGGQIVLPAIAIVSIAGAAAAYFLFMAPQNRPLMTNPPAASASSAPTEANEPPTAQASTAAPTAAPAKPAPPTAARETAKPADPAARLARAERGPPSRAPSHIAASRARAADEAGADASATAPVAASQHAPSPPQVITPPPAQ